MRKLKYTFILAIGLLFMFSACEYKFIEPKEPNVNPNDTISFSADIVPVFESKCVSCHSNNGIAVSFEAGQAYNTIMEEDLVDAENPDQSLIYTKPHPDNAHGANYSVDEAAKVLLWIQQGAENN